MKCLPKFRVLVQNLSELTATGQEEGPGRVQVLLSSRGILGGIVGIQEVVLSLKHRVLCCL